MLFWCSDRTSNHPIFPASVNLIIRSSFNYGPLPTPAWPDPFITSKIYSSIVLNLNLQAKHDWGRAFPLETVETDVEQLRIEKIVLVVLVNFRISSSYVYQQSALQRLVTGTWYVQGKLHSRVSDLGQCVSSYWSRSISESFTFSAHFMF